MSAHGFWSEAPRPDEDDARLLLAASMHLLSQVPYPELSRRAGAGPEVDEVMGLSGRPYRRSVLVDRHGRRLAVRVQIDDGTPAGRWHPLAEELVLVDPDGGTDRGDDHRGPARPGRWILAGLLVALVALVLFLAVG
jgi:hypothetical protein